MTEKVTEKAPDMEIIAKYHLMAHNTHYEEKPVEDIRGEEEKGGEDREERRGEEEEGRRGEAWRGEEGSGEERG